MESTTRLSEENKKKPGFTESTLKLIAIVTMAIDHVGAGILERMITWYGFYTLKTKEQIEKWMAVHGHIYYTDMVLRSIGRVAFPIFCFMIVEGFFHTRNRFKYAARLFMFGIISEIPFDLMLKGRMFDFGYQNVYFTLGLGLLSIWVMEKVASPEKFKNCHIIVKGIIMVITVAVFGVLAELMMTDYGAFGVLAISVMYVIRRFVKKATNKWIFLTGIFSLMISNPVEGFAALATPFVAKYNGERGLKLKYLFYAFYPVHLLIIYLITRMLGFWT